MLEKVKQFFRRRSAKTETSVDILPRNRFADLDFERILKSGTRRLVNEEGRYAENGKITELEFPEDFAEFEFQLVLRRRKKSSFNNY